MSHSSGIKVTTGLEQTFARARTEGKVRWIRVEIDHKQDPEVLHDTKEHAVGDINADLKEMQSEFRPKEPCYVLFRQDTMNVQEGLGHDWCFISYIPDGSPVKSRMLYASSKDNLKKGLGASYFTSEVHASEKDEISAEVILTKKSDVKVLSESELQVQHETRLENAERGTSVTSGDNVSVKFPLSQEGQTKLTELAQGTVNYVQLKLSDKETIELADAGNVQVSELPKKVPEKVPSYHLFRWKHNHDGQDFDSIVFVYCCPTGSKVKERMTYSTVKSTAVNYAINFKVEPAHKLEITAGDEWDEKLMTEYLHPAKVEKETSFVRPKKPGKSGAGLIKRGNK